MSLIQSFSQAHEEHGLDIGTDTFDKIVLDKDAGWVLVDFWAEWCTPCKMIAPVLDKIAGENKDKFIWAKLNVDEYPELSNKYQVHSIPNMILFHNGEIHSQRIGFMPEPAVRDWLKSAGAIA